MQGASLFTSAVGSGINAQMSTQSNCQRDQREEAGFVEDERPSKKLRSVKQD